MNTKTFLRIISLYEPNFGNLHSAALGGLEKVSERRRVDSFFIETCCLSISWRKRSAQEDVVVHSTIAQATSRSYSTRTRRDSDFSARRLDTLRNSMPLQARDANQLSASYSSHASPTTPRLFHASRTSQAQSTDHAKRQFRISYFLIPEFTSRTRRVGLGN